MTTSNNIRTATTAGLILFNMSVSIHNHLVYFQPQRSIFSLSYKESSILCSLVEVIWSTARSKNYVGRIILYIQIMVRPVSSRLSNNIQFSSKAVSTYLHIRVEKDLLYLEHTLFNLISIDKKPNTCMFTQKLSVAENSFMKCDSFIRTRDVLWSWTVSFYTMKITKVRLTFRWMQNIMCSKQVSFFSRIKE